MESLGLRCGKPFSFSLGRLKEDQSQPQSLGSCLRHHQSKIEKPKHSSIKPIQIARASATNTISPSSSSSSSLANGFGFQKVQTCSWEQQNTKIAPEKLDDWIRDSVSEIVRHIGEAPFLVHVYSPSTNTALELEREKAVEDSWPAIRRRWSQGCPIPDGVILVERLDQEKILQVEEEETELATGTKSWGVLVQGKGVDTAACYILKTCRVWSSLGFCTHFCLMKAKCFGETAELQLQNCWNGIGN